MPSDPPQASKLLLPPVYFLVAIALMVALHFAAPVLVWLAGPWRLIGILPIVAGAGIASTGALQFRRRGTAIKPFETSSTLVTDGLYRYSRNPMYIGLIVTLIGIGICLGSATPLFVIPVFVWAIRARFVRFEEASLEKQFGQAYLDFKSRVRRWL